MGKAILRVVGRIVGLCLILVALLYGLTKANELQNSGTVRALLTDALWLFFGVLLPFITARRQIRFTFSLESLLCCILCIVLVMLLSQFAWLLPEMIRSQSSLLRKLLLFVSGVFFNHTWFHIR